jgi:hypothetical protein
MPSGPWHTRIWNLWLRSTLCQLLVALPMAWERSSCGSFFIFVFLLLSCSYETQMNECFTNSKNNRPLFTFLFVFVSIVERFSLENFSGPWRVTIAGFSTFRKPSETLDDTRWILTIILVAPECQDTTGPAWLCRGTWLMRIFIKMRRGT